MTHLVFPLAPFPRSVRSGQRIADRRAGGPMVSTTRLRPRANPTRFLVDLSASRELLLPPPSGHSVEQGVIEVERDTRWVRYQRDHELRECKEAARERPGASPHEAVVGISCAPRVDGSITSTIETMERCAVTSAQADMSSQNSPKEGAVNARAHGIEHRTPGLLGRAHDTRRWRRAARRAVKAAMPASASASSSLRARS